MFAPLLIASYTILTVSCLAQDVPFRPCPLLGPRFPITKHTANSTIIREGTKNLTHALDAYVAAGDGPFGPITPNTTSFSVTLFSTDKNSDDSTAPFFYEYHHSSSSDLILDAHTVLPVGDLTTLFTVWLFLIEAGEKHWSDAVSTWIPELATNNATAHYWDEITLGDLAGHLSGLGWYGQGEKDLDAILAPYIQGLTNTTDESSACESGSKKCNRARFLSLIKAHFPVSAPGRTPIFSNTAFILLAYALEAITGRSYEVMLHTSILQPLNMTSTSLLYNHSTPPPLPFRSNSTLPSLSTPFNGLISSIHEISTALTSILSSTLLSPATTHRWLKPLSLTSNAANSVGRPWEIFSLRVDGRPTPVIPVYQVRGNVDTYTAHVGLVPDYDVGFAIMAVDAVGNADMNAIADVIAMQMVPALEKNVIMEASRGFAGRYIGSLAKVGGEGNGTSSVEMAIADATDDTAGLEVSRLVLGEVDLRAEYARLQGIEPGNLSMRLYTVDERREMDGKEKMAFRAVFQDKAALADAGTPTCETWRYVDRLQYKGVAVDEFEFEVDGDKVVGVEVKALRAHLRREGL